MDSLNPRWLEIELELIDMELEKWSEPLRNSFEQATRLLEIQSDTGSSETEMSY